VTHVQHPSRAVDVSHLNVGSFLQSEPARVDRREAYSIPRQSHSREDGKHFFDAEDHREFLFWPDWHYWTSASAWHDSREKRVGKQGSERWPSPFASMQKAFQMLRQRARGVAVSSCRLSKASGGRIALASSPLRSDAEQARAAERANRCSP
jgi:hypothetical protein